jgi:hypothetical protein
LERIIQLSADAARIISSFTGSENFFSSAVVCRAVLAALRLQGITGNFAAKLPRMNR